ncbi:conserved protein of unknown function [Ralstonia solanacearum CMR15]|nr:conserved protein of unknown function [Ralstonia solanacearum CMR15]
MTYRSEKLRRAVASIPCVNCGRHGATQAAHSNLQEHGKGMGIKATDAATMALCTKCHAEFDQGKGLTKSDRRELTFRWITATHIALLERGLLEVA